MIKIIIIFLVWYDNYIYLSGMINNDTNTNTKTSTMTMNQKIETTVKTAIKNAKSEAMFADRAVTYNDFLIELETILGFAKFENAKTKNMVRGMCCSELGRIDPKFKQHVQPRMAIDQFGNYTADASKWA